MEGNYLVLRFFPFSFIIYYLFTCCLFFPLDQQKITTSYMLIFMLV